MLFFAPVKSNQQLCQLMSVKAAFAQYARHWIRQRLESSSNAAFKNQLKSLYPPAGTPEVDFSIYPGDILIMEKENNRKRRRMIEANTQSQQPWVLSSLNALSVTQDEWSRARGFTDIDKIRELVESKC